MAFASARAVFKQKQSIGMVAADSEQFLTFEQLRTPEVIRQLIVRRAGCSSSPVPPGPANHEPRSMITSSTTTTIAT